MIKHRGFPSRLTGTDHHFTIRKFNVKEGATPLIARKRFPDRKPVDRAADRAFMAALIDHFGDQPFERGNLDAGRLSWLFMAEVFPAETPFDPKSYDALLRVDLTAAQRSFPELFEDDDPQGGDSDWDDTDD